MSLEQGSITPSEPDIRPNPQDVTQNPTAPLSREQYFIELNVPGTTVNKPWIGDHKSTDEEAHFYEILVAPQTDEDP